jgi:pimeloyl-ACP methyl ester carboxylesterase
MNAMSRWRDLPMTLEGLDLRHRMREGETPVLMVHGVGPGTDGAANFGPLLDRLPPTFAPHLIDLAGFGASDRKPAPPFFDVGFWLRQIDLAIDQVIDLHGRAPLLVGNSVGGALALKTAARRPDLPAVLAIGAPTGAPATPALRSFWSAPRDAENLADSLLPMTGAAVAPDPALVERRFRLFQSGDYGAYFDAMLADPDACLRGVALRPEEAAAIRIPVSIVHGRLDRACPPDMTLEALLPLLPDADVVLLGGCGHNVIAERTAVVLEAITRLAEKIRLR